MNNDAKLTVELTSEQIVDLLYLAGAGMVQERNEGREAGDAAMAAYEALRAAAFPAAR